MVLDCVIFKLIAYCNDSFDDTLMSFLLMAPQIWYKKKYKVSNYQMKPLKMTTDVIWNKFMIAIHKPTDEPGLKYHAVMR